MTAPADTTPRYLRDPGVISRFWSKVNKTETCWLWTGSKYSGGYGMFAPTHTKTALAHRISYILIRGPIQVGLTLDHLCRIRHCVRPDHLEPVSMKVNLLRGVGITAVNAKKTHCIHGHELSGKNLYVRKNGHRSCVACWSNRVASKKGAT